MRRKPDFIGLGAQKAGTSWLAANLKVHPQVCMPQKEIHYFSKKPFHGKYWYENKFASCPDGKVVGEFSTSYLCWDEVPEKIKNEYPNAKLLAVLRNPVDRSEAFYRHLLMRGRVDPGTRLGSIISKFPHIIEWSMYGKHLERWFGLFPREQIIVLIYDALVRFPLDVIRVTYKFLGVDTDFVPKITNERINRSVYPKWVGGMIALDKLSAKLRYKWPLERLWWDSRFVRFRNRVRAVNEQEIKVEFTESEREQLYTRFAPDVVRLEGLLGRRLGWLKEDKP